MPRETTITVLNPTAQPLAPPVGLGARLPLLEGARIGLFDNNKPNASVLLDRVGDRLVESFGVRLARYRKDVPSLEAPRDEIEEFIQRCDAVILAIGD